MTPNELVTHFLQCHPEAWDHACYRAVPGHTALQLCLNREGIRRFLGWAVEAGYGRADAVARLLAHFDTPAQGGA